MGVDIVLRVGRGLLEQLKAAKTKLGFEAASIHDMYQASEGEILEFVRTLCVDISRPLIITAKSAESLQAELVNARRRGKPVISFVSDLAHGARDAFVGIDNRNAGQTAAFLIGNLLNHRQARAGVVLGDYAFSCHEDREIGFRSNLRVHFPAVQVADVAKGEDSAERTYEAVRDLLRKHPQLDAIYNVAGGNHGLAAAVRESGRADQIQVVAHEVNHITAPLMQEGLVQFAIAQNPSDLLRSAIASADRVVRPGGAEWRLVEFAVYTKFNLPTFGADTV